MRLLFKLVQLFVLLFGTDGILAISDYPFKLDVNFPNSTETVTIKWNIDYELKSVNFAIIVKTEFEPAWLALGFSDHGQFQGSTIGIFDDTAIIDVQISKDGSLLKDRTKGFYNFKFGRFSRNQMAWTFSRKFETDDPTDYVIEDGTTQLIIAVSYDNKFNILDHSVHRKIIPTRLLRSVEAPIHFPNDLKTIKVVAKSVKIPPKETTYWCSIIELPKYLAQKHHVIQYEPAIQKQREMFVHHMEVFHCEKPPTKHANWNGPCSEISEPKGAPGHYCKRVIAAWAMGAEAFVYPPEAGMAIGGPEYIPYVMLETHYNNPSLESGVIDSSGIKFFATKQLREYDAGILETGVVYGNSMAVPPRMNAFGHTGFCPAACTEKEGIKIFGTQLHSHLVGRKLWTSQFRNGRQVGEINRDNHYSPHWQEIRRLVHPIDFLPGDTLATTCVYNTKSRENVTLGGLGIKDEMCVNYIHYYPKSKLEVCKSKVGDDALRDFFIGMNQYHYQRTSAKKTVGENYKSISWTIKRQKQLELLYKSGRIDVDCLRNDGTPFEGQWENVPNPAVF